MTAIIPSSRFAGRFASAVAHLKSRLEPVPEPSEAMRSDALFRTRTEVFRMSDQPVVGNSNIAQSISARVLAECRQTYGATIDDNTLQLWVTATVSALLTDQTRITQFVPLLAMRDIRERASHYRTGGV